MKAQIQHPTSPTLPRTHCSLSPCGCGGKVGSRAAVKLHPRLNIIDGVTRYNVRCARCKKIATTKNGAGFENWKAALRAWNHKANVIVEARQK